MDQIITRVKNILLTPENALGEVKTEAVNITEMMKSYVAVVAAIPAVATLLGMIGNFPFFRALFYSVFMYGIGLAGVLIFSKIVDTLAPHFASIKNDVNAFKLAVYSFTPAFIAGIFNFNLSLRFFTLLGSLYGIYIFYLGLPVLMETPADKRIAYTVVSILIMFIVMLVFSAVAGALVWGGAYRF